MEAQDFPLPGTAAARGIGCTCPESTRTAGTFEDPWIDAARMGLEGGSYGGQLANWIITQTDRFKAAIPTAGRQRSSSCSTPRWNARLCLGLIT